MKKLKSSDWRKREDEETFLDAKICRLHYTHLFVQIQLSKSPQIRWIPKNVTRGNLQTNLVLPYWEVSFPFMLSCKFRPRVIFSRIHDENNEKLRSCFKFTKVRVNCVVPHTRDPVVPEFVSSHFQFASYPHFVVMLD